MAKSLDYTIQLVDKLSAPATSAGNALDKTGKATRDLQEKIGGLSNKFTLQEAAMRKSAAALDTLMASENADKTAVDKLTASLSKQGDALTTTSRALRGAKEKLVDLGAASEKTAGAAASKLAASLAQAAKVEKSAADKLSATLARTAKADETAADKLAAPLTKQADKLAASSRAAERAKEKLSGLGAGAAGAKKHLDGSVEGLKNLGLNALKALGPLAAVAVGLLGFKAIAGEAIEASGKKAATLGQFESIRGTADKAKELYDHTQLIADNLNESQDKVQGLAADLLKSRMPASKIQDTITTITALERGQGPEAAAKLQSLIKGSAFKKSFAITKEDALSLGTNMNEIYQAIADETHQGVDDVKKEMAYGQITAGEGLNSLNKLLTKKNKTALEIGNNDPTKLFEKMKETFSRLFEDIDFSGLADGIRSATLMFDRTTTTGKALRAVFDGVFRFLGASLKFVMPIIGDLMDTFTLLGLKVYIALIPTFGVVRRLFKALGTDGVSFGDMFAQRMEFVADILGKIAQALAIVSQGIELAVNAATGKDTKAVRTRLVDSFKEYADPSTFVALGKQAIAGSTVGILASKFGLFSAAKEVSKAIPEGVKSELEIHSPSRVMMALGRHAGTGLRLGVESTDMGGALGDLAAQAATGVTSGARGAGGTSAGGTSARGGGGLTINVENVSVALPSGTTAEQAKSAYQQFLELIEPLAIQLGQPVGVGATP